MSPQAIHLIWAVLLVILGASILSYFIGREDGRRRNS